MSELYRGRDMVDAHIHMHEPLVSASSVIEYMDTNHVPVAMVLASPVREGAGSKSDHMPGMQKSYLKHFDTLPVGRVISEQFFARYARWRLATKEIDNPRVIEAVKERPDRLLAWIFVKPEKNMQAKLDEVKAAIQSGEFNVAGIKMHFWMFPADIMDDRVLQVAELAKELNVPLIIDVGVNSNRMKRFGEFAKRYSSVNIIAAHLGSDLSDVVDAAKENPNVFFDISGYTVTTERLLEVLNKVPPDRIIFGSDSPGGLGGDIQDSLKVLRDARLPEAYEDQILAGNISILVPKAGELLKARRVA